jgi:hypothetical protein
MNFGDELLPKLQKISKGLGDLYVRLTFTRMIHWEYKDEQVISQEYVDLDEVAGMGVIAIDMRADLEGIKNQKVASVSISILPNNK